jgi:hypothetical protein
MMKSMMLIAVVDAVKVETDQKKSNTMQRIGAGLAAGILVSAPTAAQASCELNGNGDLVVPADQFGNFVCNNVGEINNLIVKDSSVSSGIILNNVTDIAGNVEIANNPSLSQISVNDQQGEFLGDRFSVGGDFLIENNPIFQTIFMYGLESVAGDFEVKQTPLASYQFEVLDSVGSFGLTNNDVEDVNGVPNTMQIFNAPALKNIGDGGIAINDNEGLVQVNLAGLEVFPASVSGTGNNGDCAINSFGGLSTPCNSANKNDFLSTTDTTEKTHMKSGPCTSCCGYNGFMQCVCCRD